MRGRAGRQDDDWFLIWVGGRTKEEECVCVLVFVLLEQDCRRVVLVAVVVVVINSCYQPEARGLIVSSSYKLARASSDGGCTNYYELLS